MAVEANDAGPIDRGMQLDRISLEFSLTPVQQDALDQLAAVQQNPASPFFHHWLTPEQYAGQFGAAAADIATVKIWLEQQGFAVESVSRSRNRIYFNGTAGQLQDAFGVTLHNYKVPGDRNSHFAPSSGLQIPASLAGIVKRVGNLSSFRPHAQVHIRPTSTQPLFTAGGNQAVWLTPPDVATIYDVNPAYASGYNGSGQTIAVVGQSAVVAQDLINFQTALGFAVNPQTLNLVPGTGASTLVEGDETESDLDLEYASATAPGATVAFYYVGSGLSTNVYDALQYVVDADLAQIVSVSYGTCEPAANTTFLDSILEEAAVQGQTVVVAAGDNGSTACEDYPYAELNSTTAAQAPAVNYPASSPWVVGVGGTQFSAVAVQTNPINFTYWAPATRGDLIASALSYMPEEVWNDMGTGGGSGGGGASILEPRPSWQAGVPGIAAGSWRLVPDISLASSDQAPGYLICSSDSSYSKIAGSCTNGFRSAIGNEVNVIGGTRVATPIFAGLVAVLNQATGNVIGQGLINPLLYKLASNPATYASAFHDITVGANDCTVTSVCAVGPQNTDYPAGVGYDEASGLGSIDFANLLSAWPYAVPIMTTTTIVSTTTNATYGDNVGFVATVANGSGGNVTFLCNGTSLGIVPLPSGGVAVLFVSTLAVGSDSVIASYSGSPEYSPSSSVPVVVTVIPDGTTTYAIPSSLNFAYGTGVTLSAGVLANGSTTPSGGIVNFFLNGSLIGSGTLVNSIASMTLSTLPGGTDSITATYLGAADWTGSTSAPAIITVTPATTTAVLTATATNVVAGSTVMLTVALSANGCSVTAGVITFLSNGIPLGSGTVSNGIATISLSSLPVGVNSITGAYEGTSNLAATVSNAVLVTVTPMPAVTITVGIPAPVIPGSSTTSTVRIVANSSYSGTMNLTCQLTSWPIGAVYLPTCTLIPSSLTLAANSTATSTFTVQTTYTKTIAEVRPANLNPLGMGGTITIASLMMLCLPVRRRRAISLPAIALMVLSVGVVGCGGDISRPVVTTIRSTTGGGYMFTVKAMDSTSPSISSFETVAVTVE